MTSAGLKDLDRRTGEVLALLAERRELRGPTSATAFAYQQAIERAMAGAGCARLVWTAVARRRARVLDRAAARVRPAAKACAGR